MLKAKLTNKNVDFPGLSNGQDVSPDERVSDWSRQLEADHQSYVGQHGEQAVLNTRNTDNLSHFWFKSDITVTMRI